MSGNETNRYKRLIEYIFFNPPFGYTPGRSELPFERRDIEAAAAALGVGLPKNVGDVVYAIRYRTPLPGTVLATQPSGMEWVIEGDGRSRYKFCLVPINRIVPNPELATVKVPDATPEMVTTYALGDEQALLARVRYNRLIDIFLGVTAYSLQSHMRTSVAGIGQIEIDEVYVALDRNGVHYVVPVQAKGGRDQLSVVQTKQDLAWCAERFPDLVCRTVSAQFMSDERIAMFELLIEDGRVRVAAEKHYRLVPGGDISGEDLRFYRRG